MAKLYPETPPLDIPKDLNELLNNTGADGEVWTFVAKMMSSSGTPEELCAAAKVLQRSRPKVILVCPYAHIEKKFKRRGEWHRQYCELRPKTFIMDLSFARSFIRSFVRSFVRSFARSLAC